MPNPYFYTHAVPSLDMFVGREQELNEIVNGILSPRFAKSYAVIGGHRMGKTSLLLAVRQRLMELLPDHQACVVGPVFLSTEEIPILSQAAICRRVVERLREEVCAVRGWTILSDELNRPDLPDKEAIPALQKVLRAAIRGISPSFRLVILLDEVDRLTGQEWSDSFFSLLRNLVHASELAPHLSVVVAGTVVINQLYKFRGSPFFNVLAALKTLRLLSDDESRRLIIEPIEHPPSADVVDRILQLTGGQPFLIQYLMCALWDKYSGHLDVAQTSDLEAIVEQYLADRRDFEHQANGFSDMDILVYDEIAQQPAGTRVGREAVRKRLGSLKAANNALEMLVHCGAVRQHNGLEFSCGGDMFRKWFYDNVSVPSPGIPQPSLAPKTTAQPADRRNTRELIRVFVASPGDVAAERKLVQEAVDSLNGNLADESGFVLRLVCWERNSRPGLDDQGAQHWLNQLLHVESVDLLIGIFWRRFGTPTGRADSGSEEEIRAAAGAGSGNGGSNGKRKPQVMLYFSNKPAPPPSSDDEIEQMRKVFKFRKEFETKGLLWPYADEKEFGNLIREHLTQHILQAVKER